VCSLEADLSRLLKQRHQQRNSDDLLGYSRVVGKQEEIRFLPVLSVPSQSTANSAGVQTDYARDISWFVEAAAHRNSDAENQLGWMYQYGQGVEPDDARALTWYQLAADQGNIHGKRNL
jgi:TPR repeat protein